MIFDTHAHYYDDAFDPDRDALLSALPEDTPLDGWLLDTFTALPPLMARELVCAAYGETDTHLSRDRGEKLWDSLETWRDRIVVGGFVPTLLDRKSVV